MSMQPEDEQELFDDVKAIAALAAQGMNYETKRVGDMRSIFIKIFRITRHWTENQ